MIDKEAIEGRIEELSSELATLKAQLQESGLNEEEAGQSNLHWARFYRIQQKPYLGEPVWEHDSRGNIQLKASKPVWSVEHFLERNPQVLFLVYDEYDHLSPEDYNIYIDSLNSDEIPIPPPSDQLICLGDDSVEQAMDNLTRLYPDFETTFPNFSFLSNSRSRKKTSTSHLVFFYMFPQWEAKAMELAEWDTHRVMALFAFFKQTQEPHYKEIYEALDSGRLHTDDVRYLTKPGDVIIQPGPGIKAFMATSWPEYRGVHYPSPGRNTGSKDRRTRDRDSKKHRDYPSRKKQDDRGASHANEGGESGQSSHHQGFGDESCFLWAVEGWNWHIKGGKLTRQTVELELKVPCTPQIHDISSFAWYPLRYADQDIKDRLLKRGKTFWDCRERRFVGYSYKGTDKTVELEQMNERFMIDFVMYQKLHPEVVKKRKTDKLARGLEDPEEPVSENEILEQADPPTDGAIFVLPSVIVGFNLRLKKWVDIEVDWIEEVQWNKKAFENLVVDDETKHLVKALVSNQLKTEMSTDLISGKGNGLIILLHGGPGTGKTFTAESVAELAEKPLYRVTCGDIGIKPEQVEKYLETVLLLGKIWGCVVLLDEADVFLEERGLTDLKRNALVSVFLRVLEYYDGILILTSNRVGTFDQAFKSRIQLALHYENLTKPQRRKIWRNFFNRLKDLGETEVDYDDLGDHIGELAEHDMNGRQIRNAITTARQLAQFDGKKFSYAQLQHAIGVASKFETYLKGVKQGFTDDQLARDDGLR